MSLDESVQPLVSDENSDGTHFRPSLESSERHSPKCYAKLGFIATVALVAMWHVSHGPKQSFTPRSTVGLSGGWPRWSPNEDQGDRARSRVDDDRFGSLEPVRDENQATAWGPGYGGSQSEDGYAEGDEDADGAFDDWSQDSSQDQNKPTKAYGYGDDGDGWGAAGSENWKDEETTPTSTTTTTTTPHFYPSVPAIEQYINHYDPANPLNIKVKPTRNDNYFLILGDWGKAGGPGSCQLAVATRLREYVTAQRQAGKHLLFIASVGDNFYWTGATPEAWERTWSQPYGVHDPNSPLYQIPWMSLYGNHDFGNNDPHAFCPHLYPRKFFRGQPYASHQLNRDKFPDRPWFTDKYWLPDYNYHYELPEADLEVIVADTNGKVKPHIIGGDEGGRKKADANCSGQATTQDFLQKLAQSGEDLVMERARNNKAGTVLLLQHYPGKCPRDTYENALPASRKDKVKVLCAYGHVHNQACDRKDKSGLCIDILTGGGGGCCGPLVDLAGFTAVHLDSGSGVESVDVESSSVRLPAGSCKW